MKKFSCLSACLAAVVSAGVVSLPAHAESAPELALSEPEQNRLGVRFEPLGTPRTLTSTRLPGVSDVMPAQRQSLLIPFASRVESWSAQAGQQVEAGQPLLQLHSHEGLEFLQQYRRLKLESDLCRERLNNVTQRQRNGLAARLDVQEQAIQCQALKDQRTAMKDVLAHLPSDWQTGAGAEFGLSATERGWLMTARQPSGALVAAGAVLADFWPATAMTIRTRMTEAQWQQLQSAGANVQVSPLGQPSGLQLARVYQRSDVADVTGLFSVWLQVKSAENGAKEEAEIVPGQRWQVHLPAAQEGWVVPATARIRAEGQQWIFVRTPSGVRPLAVKPVAEGGGALLLDQRQNDLDDRRAVAISGASALRSLWLAGEGGE